MRFLNEDAAFVPEEENDTIYSTIKEGFHRVIARDTDVKDEVLEELIDGTLVLPQRILDRAIDIEAIFLDKDFSLQRINKLQLRKKLKRKSKNKNMRKKFTKLKNLNKMNNTKNYQLVI